MYLTPDILSIIGGEHIWRANMKGVAGRFPQAAGTFSEDETKKHRPGEQSYTLPCKSMDKRCNISKTTYIGI